MAAETKENDKKRDDAKKRQSLQLTAMDVDYIKTPLVYETTGGFGKEAKKWFKKVQLEFRKNNGDSFGSANSFTQWWPQRFAMTITSHVAACAWQAGFTPGIARPAGGNASTQSCLGQSPPSGRGEQARGGGLAPPSGPGNSCALIVLTAYPRPLDLC